MPHVGSRKHAARETKMQCPKCGSRATPHAPHDFLSESGECQNRLCRHLFVVDVRPAGELGRDESYRPPQPVSMAVTAREVGLTSRGAERPSC